MHICSSCRAPEEAGGDVQPPGRHHLQGDAVAGSYIHTYIYIAYIYIAYMHSYTYSLYTSRSILTHNMNIILIHNILTGPGRVPGGAALAAGQRAGRRRVRMPPTKQVYIIYMYTYLLFGIYSSYIIDIYIYIRVYMHTYIGTYGATSPSVWCCLSPSCSGRPRQTPPTEATSSGCMRYSIIYICIYMHILKLLAAHIYLAVL